MIIDLKQNFQTPSKFIRLWQSSINMSSVKKLLEHANQIPHGLYMLHKSRKIYLSCDAVHLMKNLRNILLKCERFIFPPF